VLADVPSGIAVGPDGGDGGKGGDVYFFVDPDSNTLVDCQYAVGEGAIFEAERLVNGRNDYKITEICPIPISLIKNTNANEKQLVKLIEHSEILPCNTKTQRICTVNDNQSSMTVSIVQGENIFKMNEIMQITFNNLPPMNRGEVEIELSIDCNEALELTVKSRVIRPEGVKLTNNGVCNVVLSDNECRKIVKFNCNGRVLEQPTHRIVIPPEVLNDGKINE